MGKFQHGNRRSAKLTPTQVLEMRQMYADGATQGQLSRYFGRSVGQVGRIVRGEQWQDYAQVPTDQEIEHNLALAPPVDPEVLAASMARLTEKLAVPAEEDTATPTDDLETRAKWMQEQAERLRPILEARREAERIEAETEAERLRKLQEEMAAAQAALPTAPAAGPAMPPPPVARGPDMDTIKASMNKLLRKCECSYLRIPPGKDSVSDETGVHNFDKCQPMETRPDENLPDNHS